MKSDTPKQFAEVSGLPVLMHTINVFHKYDSSAIITLVLPEKWFSYWEQLLKKFRFTIPHRIVKGGKERFHSVKNGLQYVPDGTLVAIHDGVRPLVSAETIRRCFSLAKKKGNAIPVVGIPESLRKIEENKNYSCDERSKMLILSGICYEAIESYSL